ncbi:MAG: glycosyltransferase, partial [Planctomycetaceae bacterium]|nr:glycosyltransferase [Planctomycetaceae bacterium]
FGLPVVVGSNVRCHRDLVLEGETGFTFPNGDREALASRLATLLHDPMLAARMGESARSHVLGYTPELSARGIAEAVLSRTGPRQAIIRKASSRGDPSAILPDETA